MNGNNYRWDVNIVLFLNKNFNLGFLFQVNKKSKRESYSGKGWEPRV